MPPSALAWLYSSLKNENSEGTHAMLAETRSTLPGIAVPAPSTRKSVKLLRARSPRTPAHQTCDRRYWNDAYQPSGCLLEVAPVESVWRHSPCRIHPRRFEPFARTLRTVTSQP